MTTATPVPAPPTLKHGPCPVCGAYSINPASQASALLAVCDVLVVRALEGVGKRIVRVDRSRYNRLGGRPFHLAHTLWQPDHAMLTKGLANAWDVVPALLNDHGCCGITSQQVTDMLGKYAEDLLITGTGHSVTELRYRFEAFLGLAVPPHHSERPDRTVACP